MAEFKLKATSMILGGTEAVTYFIFFRCNLIDNIFFYELDIFLVVHCDVPALVQLCKTTSTSVQNTAFTSHHVL